MRTHIKQAARNMHRWGYYATARFLRNKTACNQATAERCLQIACMLEGQGGA